MKRVCCFLCLLLLLTGCAANQPVSEPPTTAQPATEDIPVRATEEQTILSHEIAMLEGYVVMDEGDVRHNAGSWVNFLNACAAGEQASVSVVSFNFEADGYTYVKYDLTFDGSMYAVEYVRDGNLLKETADELVHTAVRLEKPEGPYDAYEQYSLNDVIIYTDLIAEPEFEGVNEIFLHAKEGEPPVNTYTGDDLQPILELLWNADYVPAEPENYAYGMKLLMSNRDGKELVIELDLNQGYYRYGVQTYQYGQVSDMLAALKLENWPDSVLKEFGIPLK